MNKTTQLASSIAQLSAMTIAELQAHAQAKGLVIPTNLTKKEDILTFLYADLISKADSEVAQLSEDQIKIKAQAILQKASEIDALLASHNTPQEREAFLLGLNDEMQLVDFLEQHFPTIRSIVTNNGVVSREVITSDLPHSDIVTNLPLRVLEQQVISSIQEYELLDLVGQRQVRNGVADFIYTDFKNADALSAFSDVTIDDFNGGTNPSYKETFKVKKELHAKYDILDTMLNDVAMSAGLFIAIVSDFTENVTKPITKAIYIDVVTLMDSDATGIYDEVITLTGADTKAKMKEIVEKIVSLNTTSRSHLKKRIGTQPDGFEKKLKKENAILVMDSKFGVEVKFDVTSGAYNMKELEIPVSEIRMVDFTKLVEYSSATTHKFAKRKAFLIERGLLERLMHYEATKEMPTPKAKRVFHKYMRYAIYRRIDKLAIAFDEA